MKKPKSEVEQRRRLIIDLLMKEKNMKPEDLAHRLGVSTITIRRDLQCLENKQRVIRSYGSVKIQEHFTDHINDVGELEGLKNAIAKKTCDFIENRDTVFVNTSSTAMLILRFLKDKKVNIITNNANAVFIPKDYLVNVLLTGGELREPKESMTGEFALNNISKVTANKLIMGCSGITAESGITTKVLAEVPINELMIKLYRSKNCGCGFS